MLTKRHCTITGVINFYARNEPLIAVGSVIHRADSPPYIWHYHGETRSASGTAVDLPAVERFLNENHRKAMAHHGSDRQAA